MKFSERKGFKDVFSKIQRDHMSDDLRNTIWSILEMHLWRKELAILNAELHEHNILDFSSLFWLSYLRLPITSRPMTPDGSYDSRAILQAISNYYFSCEWYEVYDFLEFVLSFFANEKDLIKQVNNLLERALSAYRFVEGTMVEITDKEEIIEIEYSIADNDFPSVRNHLVTALRLLSDKKNPDYRNSIKESISAVESFLRILTGDSKVTVGKALRNPIFTDRFHPALLGAFSKLYGYASDAEGIRHSMMNETNLTAADARFFLIICSSFINYLKSKML